MALPKIFSFNFKDLLLINWARSKIKNPARLGALAFSR
jgi:hypothetical protein